jgi:tripartite-type tricarboxylate transporter receptor subunit TctC
VVTQLARELQSVLQQKTVRDKLAGIGFEVLPSRSAEEFSVYLNDQRTKWGASIKKAGLEPQ